MGEPSPTVKSRTYQFGQSQLTLRFGDIISSEAQVLVSSDDRYLTMGGGVSAAIRKGGGNAIPLDAAKHVPAALGGVVVTTAGTLPAQYIFHAITLDPRDRNNAPSKELITNVTQRCLNLLDGLQCISIAFPAIGSGVAHFSYEDVAGQMAQAIADNLLRRDKPLKVEIYLYDRFGQMEPLDFLRFFEEFARRVPDVASRETVVPVVASQPTSANDRVFISYSHKDKIWLEKLQTMLQPLVRKQKISPWDDTAIKPGANWRQEIEKALAQMKVAVLLVSAEFLASTFIGDHELPSVLRAAHERGLTILWVLVRPCLYKETDIEAYQAAHDLSRPLAGLSEVEQAEELMRICQQIKVATNPISDQNNP